ncbi:COG4280 domain-containing protein [Rhodanobacter geophilus]|uniref:COG4280 domain-containing protein n=1 Tax=Rhodanobacter geophilus TaxID=3162488 RepID=A0ABV3QJ62_9GAMM
MPIDWIHAGATVLASFLASLVECVEALTVVLAVGVTRGWRSALAGCATGLLVLLLLVTLLGPVLARVPLHGFQLVVGALLLLFGMRWLRKAVLRAAGVLALHDEDAIYRREMQALGGQAGAHAGLDKLAFALTFKSTVLEGIEVVFIVLAIGAGRADLLGPASLGALAALLVVAALGVVLHRPLARVPENLLKFAVGVLLCAFGTFWAGEGMGYVWPGADWAIPGLVGAFLAVSALGVPWCRRLASAGAKGSAR